MALRVFRRLWLVAVPLLVGAIVVVVWFLLVPWVIIPPIASESTLVRNGVAAIVVCGEMRERVNLYGPPEKYVPRVNTGLWLTDRKGDCTVWFHTQPGE